MFEVNLFTPRSLAPSSPGWQSGEGPYRHSCIPTRFEGDVDSTESERRNHSQRAIWMGERLPLDLSLFDKIAASRKAKAAAGEQQQ